MEAHEAHGGTDNGSLRTRGYLAWHLERLRALEGLSFCLSFFHRVALPSSQ